MNSKEDIKTLSDEALIKLIKNDNDSLAFQEIENRHKKLFFRAASKYTKKCPALKYEEIILDTSYVIGKAIVTYKPEKGAKFVTWVGNFSRYFMLNTIKQSTADSIFQPHEVKDIDFYNKKNNSFSAPYNEDLKNHVFNILSSLKDKRVHKIFELRYYSDKKTQKWANIAKELNLSVQQTMNLYNSGKSLLYKQMTKENNNK